MSNLFERLVLAALLCAVAALGYVVKNSQDRIDWLEQREALTVYVDVPVPRGFKMIHLNDDNTCDVAPLDVKGPE